MTDHHTGTFEYWPGPMEGISHPGFVRCVNKLHLTRRWMTPFLRISGNVPSSGKIRKFLAPFMESEVPVVCQLMGTDPAKLAETAAIAIDCKVAGINLNCGCPSKRVVKGGAGGGILGTPDLMREISEKIKSRIGETEFSLKIRSGWHDWHEMESFLPPLLADGCVDKLFFHYRTTDEAYLPVQEKESRFLTASQLCTGIPLVLNGDLSDDKTLLPLLKKCQAAGAMFARSWLRDPFMLCRLQNECDIPADQGREKFFSTLLTMPLSAGEKIEAAKMIWGINSVRFREMTVQIQSAEADPCSKR